MSGSSTALLHNTTDANVKESELINSGRDTNYNVQNTYNIAVFYDVIGFFQTAAQLFVALIHVNQLKRVESTNPLPQAATDDDPQSAIPEDSVEISNIMPQDPSLLPVSSIADKYTRSMLECLVGYPLYEPQPFSQLSKEYSHKGVHVGDVGFIREDGAFDFLFNICPPQNDLINPPNLPDGFSLETSEYSETRPMRPLSCGTCHFSRTVTKTESGEYMCKGSEGAILVLPEGAIRDEAIHRKQFEDLAKLHGVEWYEYTLNRGRSISNGSLYLVTSFVKCTQWGTAVFDRPCEPGQALRFVSSPLGWKGLGALTTEVADPNQGDTPNQCVFLRGYKIMIRQDIFDRLPKRQRASRIRGGGGSDFMSRIQSILSDRRRLSRTTMSTTKKPEDVVLNPSFNSSPVHPSDLINAALLSQHPAAKVALTHDDVWCDLLRDNFPELTYASLMNITLSYTSTIDENGCVSLEKIPDSTIVLDESNHPLQEAEVPALQKAIPDGRNECNPNISRSFEGSTALRPPIDNSPGDGAESDLDIFVSSQALHATSVLGRDMQSMKATDNKCEQKDLEHPDVSASGLFSSTVHVSPSVGRFTPISGKSTISPRTLPSESSPGSHASSTLSSIRTPPQYYMHESASRLHPMVSLGGTSADKLNPSISEYRDFGIRDRSPLWKIDDTFKHWEAEVADVQSKSRSGPWTKLDKRKNAEMQRLAPGLQHVGNCVLKASASVLGPTVGIAHHADIQLVPLPGLEQAARMLLEIWDELNIVDMNRIACFRLVERCAEILRSAREEIHAAGDVIGDDLKAPIDKLTESFSLVYNLLHEMNRTPYLKRYLKRSEMLRRISECDRALTDAFGLFSIYVQLRILRQLQVTESQRQHDTTALLDRIKLLANVPQLTEVKTSSTGVTDSQTIQASSVDVPPLAQQPTLIFDDVPKNFTGVIPQLREIHDQHNVDDAAKDLADLRHFVGVVVQTTNDVLMLEGFQTGSDEMPEAVQTSQRALEKINESDQSFDAVSKPGQQPSSLKHSKMESSTEIKDASSDSVSQSRVQDTLDRSFIESGLYALRRMSQGVEVTLPSWTITRYEVDREEKIGISFFSEVYKGKWRGRTVAIRVLAETVPRELFAKEVQVWKSLHHPNVLELYGTSSVTSDPPWFVVSPYEKNGSLPAFLWQMRLKYGALRPVSNPSAGLVPGSESSSSIRKTNLAENLTARTDEQDVPKELDLYRFMQEIAKGMDYLHNVEVIRGDSRVTGIVHGDLKAANVLIDDRFHCIISDFGQKEMKSEVYRISGLPLPHGTLRWQAPELMEGAHIMTTAIDVYAFAICCIEILLLGGIPWPLNDDSDIRYLVLVEDQRPVIPVIPPFNSSALKELINRCWDKDPSTRPTFTTIVEEIEFIRRNAGESDHNNDIPDVRDYNSQPATQGDYARHSLHGVDASTEPPTAHSSVSTHTSPIPHDHQVLERKHEIRYRLLLLHEFHPILTLPLWKPTQIQLGAVGYLSRLSGSFVTLFDAFSPSHASNAEARKIPSLYTYGVECGTQLVDKRNIAQRSLDMITGLMKFGSNTRNVARRYSYRLRSGHKEAFMCVEKTVYWYMKKLDAPKRWFTDNIDRILKTYDKEHSITREDVFLVIGTLDSVDHALFVSHRHPDTQLHFDVFAVPRNSQPWGKFTFDTQRSPVEEPDADVGEDWAARVSKVGEGAKTVLLARLRFKPGAIEPTSL